MRNVINTLYWLMLILLLTSAENLKAEKDMRNHPSIFQAWNGIENRPNENELHRLARHDLIVNANTRQIPKSAPYVNGIFMECYKQEYAKGYSLDQILQIEETLLWAEQHLREPRINCLEGWRVVTDNMGDLNTRVAERNSEENQQWMRMMTTLSLTHSDGYVLFGDDNAILFPDHLHNWYDFWDVDLGQPIEEKAVQYQGIVGLFVRAFENGWAVYNRSGSKQTVTFTDDTTGINSGKRQRHHEVSDFDGEILLKTDRE